MGFFYCQLRSGRGGPGQELIPLRLLSAVFQGCYQVRSLCGASFSTPLILTFMGCTLGVRLCPRSGSSDMSSWVKTEQNWSPLMLALFRLSEKVSPSFFSGATPVLSFLRDLMKFQKHFGFLLSFVSMSFV